MNREQRHGTPQAEQRVHESQQPHVDVEAPEEGVPESFGDSSSSRPWRVAKSLSSLRDQINAAYPRRGKANDGTIGDAAHQSRVSDHNPHVVDGPCGVVTALDITHDPDGGCDAGEIVSALHASRDPRIKYLIWNRRIANASPIGNAEAWGWRSYKGGNPHDKHCHVSVQATKSLYDDERAWDLPRAETESVRAGSGRHPEAHANALSFIESAYIEPCSRLEAASVETAPLDIDRLPAGVVSGNSLIDFSATPSVEVRSAVSMALLFASRAADAAMKAGDDEDDWYAAYMTNLSRLGFSVTQSSVTVSRFKKAGVFVHKAIIPFLTIALGGAGVGPVILAALNNLHEMDQDAPWITLFDRQSRKFAVREMHFAAVSSDGTQTSIRHVVARLSVGQDEINVLFFRITTATADFESGTTTMSASNSMLAVVEPLLRARMEADITSFISATPVSTGALPP